MEEGSLGIAYMPFSGGELMTATGAFAEWQLSFAGAQLVDLRPSDRRDGGLDPGQRGETILAAPR